MEQACLVTGKSGPLVVELVRCLESLNRRTLVTRSGQMDLGEIDEDSTTVISWNRRSALSARSVLLHASNVFGRLDEAIVVFSPAADTATFHESSIVGIEDRIDAEVKGYLYILRETLASMLKQGGGSVAIVVHLESAEFRSPLESTATGAFVSLAESLARLYNSEDLSVKLFRSDSGDLTGFANFVCDGLLSVRRRRNARWRRFGSGVIRRLR